MRNLAQIPKRIGVVGFPFSDGQPRSGAELGPAALREAGFVSTLEAHGNTVNDYGDLNLEKVADDPPVKGAKNPKSVGFSNKKLADAVSQGLKENKTVITLGGDHSMAIGSIFGHAKVEPDLVVVWVDAHADINTPNTSTTGNMHGMPLSFLLKELTGLVPALPGFEWCSPCLSIKDLVYIALRDVDPPERAIIEEYGIASYSMQEVDEYGISEVVDRALKQVDPSGKRPIHLSFDVDGMDPTLTPSTGTPVPGGLTFRESQYLAEKIAETGRLSVLDVAEVNPKLGSDDKKQATVSNTVDVMSYFFGRRRQGNAPAGYVIPRP